jgi:hypothetical protein
MSIWQAWSSMRQLLQAQVPQASPGGMTISMQSCTEPPPPMPVPVVDAPPIPVLAVDAPPIPLLELEAFMLPAPVAPEPPDPFVVLVVSSPPHARGAAAIKSRALKAVILDNPFIFIARSFVRELLDEKIPSPGD